MEYLIIGLVSAFNMLIIKFKLDRKRYEDAVFDTALMLLLAYLFAGSYGGMVVAMVASLVISIFLFISPPRFTGKASKYLTEQWDDFESQLEGRPTKTKKQEPYNL
jgi:hypothetical protein